MYKSEPSSLLRALVVSGLIASTANLTQAAAKPSNGSDTAANSLKNQPKIAQNYGKLPLSFEANQGQSDPQVKFQSRGQGYSLFLTDRAAVLSLTKTTSSAPTKNLCHPERTGAPTDRSSSVGKGSEGPASRALSPRLTPCQTETDTLTLELTHSNPNLSPVGTEELSGHANYFLGNDPAKWHTNVPTYAKVAYRGVYNGIDLVYYGNQRQLEYDFVVAPGANPKSIQLHFAGAQKLHLTPTGDLEVTAKNGQIAFHKPEIYQTIDGQRQTIPGTFTLAANHSIHFQIGNYDPTQPLIIDPMLIYSTYLGGSIDDLAYAIAVDHEGEAFVVGETQSADFPVTGGSYSSIPPNDLAHECAFISKLNSTGSALIYSTFLGASGNGGFPGENANAVAVDNLGNAYIAGETYSTDFPVTEGAFQSKNETSGSRNAFVTKVNPSGDALVYSTYLGGSGQYGDYATAIAIDGSYNAYVAGTTSSVDFPISTGSIQGTNKTNSQSYTAFVTALNATGTGLIYSTYLGGSYQDAATSIAVMESGTAYVAGTTFSGDFPITSGAFQTTNKENYGNPGRLDDARTGFVAALNQAGTALLYSTYLGGSSAFLDNSGLNYGDQVNGIALDNSGAAYVTGQTASSDFPITIGAFQDQLRTDFGQPTAFITKLSPNGASLIYSTFLGGGLYDAANAIAVDQSGNASIAGYTVSSNFPLTTGAFQAVNKARSCYEGTAFVAKLSAGGEALLYSTYFGGAGDARATGVGFDTKGGVYFTGYTTQNEYCAGFPVTEGSFEPRPKSISKNTPFVAKFNLTSAAATTASSTAIASSANPQTAGAALTFTATVTGLYTTLTPTGSVTFVVDGSALASVSLSQTGVATLAPVKLSAGSHSIQAKYSGSSTLAPSSRVLVEKITLPPATPPVFSIPGGTFTSGQSVQLSSITPGATIYYALHGITPTTSSPKYIGPITVSASETIQAIAIAPGYAASPIAKATYTIKTTTAAPVFSLPGGTYTGPQSVKLTSVTPSAAIYYALHGVVPTTKSIQYTGPITVSSSETIQAIAIAPGDATSPIAKATYTIK